MNFFPKQGDGFSPRTPTFDTPSLPPPTRGSSFRVFNRSSIYTGYSTLPTQPPLTSLSPGGGAKNGHDLPQQLQQQQQHNRRNKINNILRAGKRLMRKLPSLDDDGGPEVAETLPPAYANSGDINGSPSFLREEEEQDEGISPHYEDSEDLESAIFKLRALLSEKESSEDGEAEKKEEDEDEKTVKIEDEKEEKDSEKEEEKEGEEEEPDGVGGGGGGGVSALKASDMPMDGRLIINVRVPETEVVDYFGDHQEIPSPSAESDEGAVLYCIRYEGIYLEQLPSSSSSSGGGTRFRYVLQPRLVRRTFREFLNLQASLEGSPRLRGAVRGVKGPGKWINMSYSKQTGPGLESKRYEKKLLFCEVMALTALNSSQFSRAILGNWLAELCQIPQIAVSQEFKEFLAYGDDGTAAFNRGSNGEQTRNKIEKVNKKHLPQPEIRKLENILFAALSHRHRGDHQHKGRPPKLRRRR